MAGVVGLRERAWRYDDVGSPFCDPTIRPALEALGAHEVTPMAVNESSFRYPWKVESVERLAAEMERAKTIHGRVGVCGWICPWVHPTRVIMWEEARRLVEAWSAAAMQKSGNAK
jgi:hypothetical protein